MWCCGGGVLARASAFWYFELVRGNGRHNAVGVYSNVVHACNNTTNAKLHAKSSHINTLLRTTTSISSSLRTLATQWSAFKTTFVVAHNCDFLNYSNRDTRSIADAFVVALLEQHSICTNKKTLHIWDYQMYLAHIW
jgi:hypothetical protein